AGRVALIAFLKSEFSEENILFWLACEEYKQTKSTSKMIERSKEIFLEYVKVGAPKEINIDCGTRENITRHISTPTLNSFDHAQKIIYSLLAKDCYPRFLKSDIYMAYCQQNESRKDQKGCVESIVVNSDSPLAKPSKSCTEKQTLPQSLEKLLADKCGLAAFREFLRSEFSEENIEFWMACEDYKKDTSPANLSSKAKEIYNEFVQSQARKEINIDHQTRESIKKAIQEPGLSCFDEAQKQVYSLMEKDSCTRLTTEEALLWSQSLEKLLESKYGMTTFRAFLRSEFSDENIEFWLTCEDFKKVKSSRLSSKAKKIYEHYIRAEAPKEINIDHHTRETINSNVQSPTIHCFDDAQKIVYGLMERDSYPRFLRSDIYQTLSGKLQPGSVNG
ncbi:RGS3 protein, partial [Polyodon spathula]|nr:RGS3 protein [Polyodon spathula]